MADTDIDTIEGRVIEALPSTLFRVDTGNGKIMLSYLGGKMRIHKIKVLVGDKVLVQVDPYGGKGRIIKRI
ncbi:MAG: translation initiation factor translation initiation factor [Candidatus Nomurabacteria bacterium]|nr:translation initiation factor translation initiation factor [Candidatus Nomurabacteria bacterium]